MWLIKKLHFVVECSPSLGRRHSQMRAFTGYLKGIHIQTWKRRKSTNKWNQDKESDWWIRLEGQDYIGINHWNYSISLSKLKELSMRNTGANSCSEVWDQLAGLSGSRLKAAESVWRRVSVWDDACPLVHSMDVSWTAGRVPGTILGPVGRAGTVAACRRSRSAAADPRFLLASHFTVRLLIALSSSLA